MAVVTTHDSVLVFDRSCAGTLGEDPLDDDFLANALDLDTFELDFGKEEPSFGGADLDRPQFRSVTPNVARKSPSRMRKKPSASARRVGGGGAKKSDDLTLGGTTVQQRYMYFSGQYHTDATRASGLTDKQKACEMSLFDLCAPVVCMVLVGAKNVNPDHHIFSHARSGGVFLRVMRDLYETEFPRIEAKSPHVVAFEEILSNVFTSDKYNTQRTNCGPILVACIRFVFETAKNRDAFEKLKPFVDKAARKPRPAAARSRAKKAKREEEPVEEPESEPESESESESECESESESSSGDDDDEEPQRENDTDRFASDVKRFIGTRVWDKLEELNYTNPSRISYDAMRKQCSVDLDDETFHDVSQMARCFLMGL